MLLALRKDRVPESEVFKSLANRFAANMIASAAILRRKAPFTEVRIRCETQVAIRQPLNGVAGRPACWERLNANGII